MFDLTCNMLVSTFRVEVCFSVADRLNLNPKRHYYLLNTYFCSQLQNPFHLMLSSRASLDDVPASSITGKRILLRADFNVPIDEKSGAITDKTRITSTIPTIKKLQALKVSVVHSFRV